MSKIRLLFCTILMLSSFSASAQFYQGRGSNMHSYRPNDAQIVLSSVYFIPNAENKKRVELNYGEKGTPHFGGGYACLKDYIEECINYPIVDLENGVQGSVVCSVEFSRVGGTLIISDVEIIRGISQYSNNVCKRILSDSPNWEMPENSEYSIYNMRMQIAILFKLRT